jgi:hypothetical protein
VKKLSANRLFGMTVADFFLMALSPSNFGIPPRLVIASFSLIFCGDFSFSLEASDADPSKALVKANQEICVITLGNLSLDLSKPENQDWRRIVAALKHDYVQSGSFDSAAQLVTVGVARTDVNNLMRPHIEGELGRLEQISSPQRLDLPPENWSV